MKKPVFVALLMFTIFQINAQTKDSRKIEHGILFSPRIDSDDDFTFKIKGFGVEGGYYLLKKVGKRGMISLDFRLAYAQSEREYMNAVNMEDFSFFADTIITIRTGTVYYKNLSLSIPIKYRYQFSEKIPIFFMVGFNPYFNLSNNTTWKYDEFEYDRIIDMNISENRNQEETLEQNFYSQDIILAGFGYKKDKLMFDIYFSGGSINFDNDFIKGMDKLSIVLNAYYRLN
jgi:hypothetical protein